MELITILVWVFFESPAGIKQKETEQGNAFDAEIKLLLYLQTCSFISVLWRGRFIYVKAADALAGSLFLRFLNN